jgi:hypothetical protein
LIYGLQKLVTAAGLATACLPGRLLRLHTISTRAPPAACRLFSEGLDQVIAFGVYWNGIGNASQPIVPDLSASSGRASACPTPPSVRRSGPACAGPRARAAAGSANADRSRERTKITRGAGRSLTRPASGHGRRRTDGLVCRQTSSCNDGAPNGWPPRQPPVGATGKRASERDAHKANRMI